MPSGIGCGQHWFGWFCYRVKSRTEPVVRCLFATRIQSLTGLKMLGFIINCFSGTANAKQFGAVQKEWFTQKPRRNSQNTQIANYRFNNLCAFCATC
jgi:hypothetical protein